MRGTMLALTLGRPGIAYPALQFSDGGVLDSLDLILAEMRDTDPWSQMAFFVNPKTWLNDETPLHALQLGRVVEVRDAARAYGDQAAT